MRTIASCLSRLFIALILVGCNASEEIQPPVTARDYLTVKSEQIAESTGNPQNLEFSGKVRATKSTSASFLRGGRIVSLNKDDGDRVSAGELLGRLDTRSIQARQEELRAQLVQAQAASAEIEAPPRRFEREAANQQVKEIKASLDLVETKLARRRELFSEGAIPKEDLDELESRRNTLLSQRRAARNRVKDIDVGARPETKRVGRARVEQVRTNLQSLEVDIADSELRAPFAATVSRRLVDEGTIVSAGQAVYDLVTEGNLEVEVFLPPARAQKLSPGQLLDLTIEGEEHKGRVLELLPRVENGSGTRPVLLGLPRTAGVQVGQLARVSFEQEGEGEGYWLPSPALLPGERGLFTCYTLSPVPDETGIYEVKKQAVELVETTGKMALVRGTLSGTQDVITEGIQRVVPGQKVRKQ